MAGHKGLFGAFWGALSLICCRHGTKEQTLERKNTEETQTCIKHYYFECAESIQASGFNSYIVSKKCR